MAGSLWHNVYIAAASASCRMQCVAYHVKPRCLKISAVPGVLYPGSLLQQGVCRYPQCQTEQYAYTEGKGRKGKEHTEGERECYHSPISDRSINALMVD